MKILGWVLMILGGSSLVWGGALAITYLTSKPPQELTSSQVPVDMEFLDQVKSTGLMFSLVPILVGVGVGTIGFAITRSSARNA